MRAAFKEFWPQSVAKPSGSNLPNDLVYFHKPVTNDIVADFITEIGRDNFIAMQWNNTTGGNCCTVWYWETAANLEEMPTC